MPRHSDCAGGCSAATRVVSDPPAQSRCPTKPGSGFPEYTAQRVKVDRMKARTDSAKIPLFRKSDIIIIAAVLAIAALSLLFAVRNTSSADSVVVRINGEIAAEYSCYDTGEYEIKGENDIKLTLVISPQGVSVQSASCPDKLCEKTGIITNTSQSIICLPGRISITLEGQSGEVDAVVG